MKRIKPVLILLWVAVIFGFSLHSGQSSHLESVRIQSILVWLFHFIGIRNVNYVPVVRLIDRIYHYPFVNSPEVLVRKCAHFTEYFVLGALSTVTLSPSNRRSRGIFLANLAIGPIVALLDEKVVQAFLSYHRTARYLDVALDSLGFFCGTAAVFLLIGFILMISRISQPHREKI